MDIKANNNENQENETLENLENLEKSKEMGSNPLQVILEDWETLEAKIKKKGGLKPNPDKRFPLLKVWATKTEKIPGFETLTEEFFGKPLKPRGNWGLWVNYFDPLVRGIGGCRTDQVLYLKKYLEDSALFCAFWPWGSDPSQTSIRLGIFSLNPRTEMELLAIHQGAQSPSK